MVTAHPVPHPRETPTTGDDAGARSGGAQMGIVSGRLNHENSKRRLKVPGFEGAETASLMPPAAPPPVWRVELPMLARDEYRTWELDKWAVRAVT